MTLLRTRLLTLLTIFICIQPVSAQVDINGSTKLMNSYGEEMELSFSLSDPGEAGLIDYALYGEMLGLDTGNYKYQINNRKGLSAAVGEGVYPSNSVYTDPAYITVNQAGKLRGSHWDFTNIDNHQLMFYKWATAAEAPGVKQFFTASALEKAGYLKQAIRAYHAVIIHFPKQTGWTIWHTPIYYAQRAIDKIEFLTRTHPELGLLYVDYEYEVKHGDDLEISNDEYLVLNPGRLIAGNPEEYYKAADLNVETSQVTVGGEHVQLHKYSNGHWQMRVDGEPFMIKAVAYEPTPVGQSTHDGSRTDWMTADMNKNGIIDGPYESWVDANGNNEQDASEVVMGDFELLKQMGANSLRHYHGAQNKQLLTQAYDQYGLMAIIGNLLGMYGVGSNSDWYKGTDFTNPEHLASMRQSIIEMVKKHKDEPYLLMWVLSNEGNYGFVGDPTKPKLQDRLGLGSNGKSQYKEMYIFANEMAKMIKELDPNHPVAFSNGETIYAQTFGQVTPDIDIFGVNAYRGSNGFGQSFWNDIKRYTDKPVFLTEFGCPAFHNRKSLAEAEVLQSAYLQGNWEDMLFNQAGAAGAGNSIGGTLFQFVDEWWKAGPAPEFDPYVQESVGDFQADFPDGWMHEEWLGVTSQGDGTKSPYLRKLRKSYFYFKEVWNN